MVSTATKILATSVVLAAVLYQTLLKGFIFDVLGYGREISPPSNFNLRCEKLENLGLEGCEDMWLHEPSGLLYAACGHSLARVQWFPPSDHLNASGRESSDRIAILDTRGSGPVKDRLSWMTTPGFTGNHGDGDLDLHGIDIKASTGSSPTLKVLLVNHRPPIDPQTGLALDASKSGANSTIEVFETVVGETTMKHVKTYFDPVIETPNDVAWISDGSFVFTNDRSGKVGLRRALDIPLKSSGSVGYCGPEGCRLLATLGLAYPNGIIQGKDGLIYVANSATGDVHVFELQLESSSLRLVDTVKIPHPIDNLSLDSNGDIFAASFPQLHKYLKSTDKPLEIFPPAAGWRIRKSEDGTYHLDKVLEGDGSVLPSATIVVHDPQAGRMFLGSPYSPFISMCEPL